MRRSNSITIRQPAAEGPDVVYNGSDFDIYVDARYLGSRANSQDAWMEARRVYFEAIEAATTETADIAAEVAEARADGEFAALTIDGDGAELYNSECSIPVTPALARALRQVLNDPAVVAWMGA